MLSVVCTVFLQESKLEKRKCYQENHKENTFIVFFFQSVHTWPHTAQTRVVQGSAGLYN